MKLDHHAPPDAPLTADCGCIIGARGERLHYCPDHALMRAAYLCEAYGERPDLARAIDAARRGAS